MAHPLPRTFLLDAAPLAQLALLTRSGRPGALARALDRVVGAAESALTAGPWSVMDKALTPPSGDKHDYMSMSSYVWPDPTRPGGLPYVMRDGQRNPETEKYDEAPLRRMCAAVQALSVAAFYTGNDAYATAAARLVRTWFLDPATSMNPHLNFGQCVPGQCTGHRRGIVDASSTLPHLLDHMALVAAVAPEAWPEGDRAALRTWMAAFLDWLLTSEFGKVESQINNNHAVACDVLVASLALHTDRPEVARDRLDDARTRRVAVQIWPDGSMPREIERTMGLHYVVWNLRCFLHLAKLGEHVGVDLKNYRSSEGRSIALAAEWALPYLDLATPWPHQQIVPVDPDRIILLCREAETILHDRRFGQVLERLASRGVAVADNIANLLFPAMAPAHEPSRPL